jgi:hypothetical protein
VPFPISGREHYGRAPFVTKPFGHEDIERFANRDLGDSILSSSGTLDNLLARHESPRKNFLAQARRNALFQQAAWLAPSS